MAPATVSSPRPSRRCTRGNSVNWWNPTGGRTMTELALHRLESSACFGHGSATALDHGSGRGSSAVARPDCRRPAAACKGCARGLFSFLHWLGACRLLSTWFLDSGGRGGCRKRTTSNTQSAGIRLARTRSDSGLRRRQPPRGCREQVSPHVRYENAARRRSATVTPSVPPQEMD